LAWPALPLPCLSPAPPVAPCPHHLQSMNAQRYAHFWDIVVVDGTPQRVFSNPFARATKGENLREFLGLLPPLPVTREALRERVLRCNAEVRGLWALVALVCCVLFAVLLPLLLLLLWLLLWVCCVLCSHVSVYAVLLIAVAFFCMLRCGKFRCSM
jgi:hypothetical protein